jgi:hypothetical protein
MRGSSYKRVEVLSGGKVHNLRLEEPFQFSKLNIVATENLA